MMNVAASSLVSGKDETFQMSILDTGDDEKRIKKKNFQFLFFTTV